MVDRAIEQVTLLFAVCYKVSQSMYTYSPERIKVGLSVVCYERCFFRDFINCPQILILKANV
jgi:hypothetical protein